MRNTHFKILTFLWFALLLPSVHGFVLNQEKNKTHLRLNIFTARDFLSIDKRGEKLYLKTLNQDFYNQLVENLKGLELDRSYIKDYKVSSDNNGQVYGIEMTLTHPRVELFSFYRDRENKYVLDFWTDEKSSTPVDSTQIISSLPVESKPAEAQKMNVSKDTVTVKESRAAPARVPVPAKTVVKSPYRDFRYGASFIWDYHPISPSPAEPINLSRKTPEHFFPFRDRNIDTSEEEAHIQLSLNLYRESKWGLMAKSIQLFEKKYPQSKLVYLNEYLKANALLRENFDKGNSEPVKLAITMFENLGQTSPEYEMRKGISKYLITYFFRANEHLRALQHAKKFYVDSKENFDYEESRFAVEMMFANLAKLNQVDSIKEIAADKTLQKIMPAQLVMAYEIYSLLSLGNTEAVIERYQENERGLSKPIEPSLLFNVAEAYFRTAQYEKAIRLFDDFIAQYSHMTQSSHARLRIALSYDLLDRDFLQTRELYRNAINRSQDLSVSYEARIRYAAMRSVRPFEINDSDREVRVFLERDRRLGQEVNQQLRELLWLVRLRTFIVDGKFQEALTYLNAIPMASMPVAKRRVYEGDGAEVIYGLILEMFKKADYGRAVQVWDVYKQQYLNKVAEDSFMNFVVGKSYLKLGLYNAFDEVYTRFNKLEETPQRTFPLWVDREGQSGQKELLVELQIIRHLGLKNWNAAETELKNLASLSPRLNKIHYYQGIIFYRQQNYQAAARSLETYLSNQTQQATYDPTEVAEMMLAYSDSLYQLKDGTRFRRVAEAILNDTRDFAKDNKYMKEVREKVAYLLIENYASDDNAQSSLIVESKIAQFKTEFTQSIYLGRINLLLGMAFLKNEKNQEAREVFETLVGDEKTPDVIKELARSELSLIRIKERTI